MREISKTRLPDMGRNTGFDDLEVKDFEELLASSYGDELSNEDLIELDAQGAQEEAEANIKTPPKVLTTKILAEVLKYFKLGTAIPDDNNPNRECSSVVIRKVSNDIRCNKEIYNEKKKASIKLSLDQFL